MDVIFNSNLYRIKNRVSSYCNKIISSLRNQPDTKRLKGLLSKIPDTNMIFKSGDQN